MGIIEKFFKAPENKIEPMAGGADEAEGKSRSLGSLREKGKQFAAGAAVLSAVTMNAMPGEAKAAESPEGSVKALAGEETKKIKSEREAAPMNLALEQLKKSIQADLAKVGNGKFPTVEGYGDTKRAEFYNDYEAGASFLEGARDSKNNISVRVKCLLSAEAALKRAVEKDPEKGRPGKRRTYGMNFIDNYSPAEKLGEVNKLKAELGI